MPQNTKEFCYRFGWTWRVHTTLNMVESHSVAKSKMSGLAAPYFAASLPATADVLLYVDLDGVVQHEAVYWHPRRGAFMSPSMAVGRTLFEWVPQLEEALAPFPDVRLVLSSTWCIRPGFSKTLKNFPPALRSKFIGGTFHKRHHGADLPGELVDEMWRRFIAAMEPLKRVGKLKAVHFQFPPWVQRNRSDHAHVRECVQRMAGHLVAVEFRHASWFEGDARQGTLDFEKELGVVHTVVDGSQGFDNSVPTIWEATHPELAILRLHGRNQEAWNPKGQAAFSDRFNYDYGEAELAGLVNPILALATKVGTFQVVFNNNMEDQGQRNARTMMRMLGVLSGHRESLSPSLFD